MRRGRIPMTKILYFLKLVLVVFIAVIIGVFGLSLFFSDFGPSETVLSRGLTIFILFLISGVLIGYIVPEAWPMSGLIAWGAVLIGAVGLLGGRNSPLEEVALLFLPLGFALGAGYAGAVLRRKKILYRLLGRK